MRHSLGLVAALGFVSLAAVAEAADRSAPSFVWNGSPVADPIITGGGNGCPPGEIIASLPFSDPGNTCDNSNTITNYTGTCTLPFPYGGENAIYQLTLGAGNAVAFSADITGSTGDLALFLVSTCGNGATCVANSTDLIGPGVGPEAIASASYAPGTYFLYVDSYYNAGSAGSCGTYTLSVTGTIPVELMEFGIE
jgi:hypothetical protein